jgi:diacylglycerol kinase (ATP)
MVNSAAAERPASQVAPKRHIFVALNPGSGRADPETMAEMIGQAFGEAGVTYTIHLIEDGEDVVATVRAAVAAGYSDVVAAGGDGTISAVASGLLNSAARMGILPIGTANVLARELDIPLDLAAASALIVAPHKVIQIDAMGLPDRVAVLQIGVGLGSVMIRDTQDWAKRLVGRAAYLWTALSRLFGFEPRRFRISVDGKLYRVAAMQVEVANGGVLGMPPFRWGPDIDPSDGRIDVAILRAENLLDKLRLAWALLLGRHRKSPNLHYLHAHRSIEVAAHPPLPVQADGEIIGETPCTIKVIRAAVSVIVPLEHTAPPEAELEVGGA